MKRLSALLALFGCLLCGGLSAAPLDKYVDEALLRAGIPASGPASDAVLLRRLTLITTDRIPTPEQAAAWLASPDRVRLTDSLLQSEGWVEKLTLKWGDLLRIKSEFPSNHWPNAVQAYNKWLTDHLRANTPYDVFVRELLVSTGSGFRVAPTNFYRTGTARKPADYAASAALLFTGRRTAPAEWGAFFTQVRFKNTSEWKEEILWLDADTKPPYAPVKMEDGRTIALMHGTDFRAPFADWLTSERQFARAMANRTWFWLMGRGITEPCDDFRADNPPANPALLEYLTDRLIESKYDLRALAREILLSDAFARSSLSTAANRADSALFSHYPARRLTAEQLCDAMCDVTGVPDHYSSRTPEPFMHYPDGTRATQIGDGTITTAQLDLFGRPSRDYAVESTRDDEVDAKQVLFLLNSKVLTDKLHASPRLTALLAPPVVPRKVVGGIYLAVLGRNPSQAEVQAVVAWSDGPKNQKEHRRVAETLAWALMNSDEFLFLN